MSLVGQVAVVTGAANGIGRASALRLAAGGARVALLDIEEARLGPVAGQIRAGGGESLSLALDLTDRQATVDAFARIEERLGPVGILFNNVGQSARERASEFCGSAEETWRFVLEVSLLTAMRCARLVAPAMRDRGAGRIINMSSESALYGDIGLVDYAAAKLAVVGFTRALARELAPHGVNVNAVAPGAIRTRAHDRLPREVIDRVRTSVPMGWIGEPEDVAGVVAFLAGPDSRYVTGQTLVIDGGRWMV